MAAADKMCGCCGEWQDLKEVGTQWDNEMGIVPKYKRFHILNACESCAIFYRGKGFDLTNSKVLKATHVTHKQHWGKFWFQKNDGSGYELRFGLYDVTLGKTRPWLWEIDLPFANGLIRSQDKRKLRRGLRKMGCRGKIERVIL